MTLKSIKYIFLLVFSLFHFSKRARKGSYTCRYNWSRLGVDFHLDQPCIILALHMSIKNWKPILHYLKTTKNLHKNKATVLNNLIYYLARRSPCYCKHARYKTKTLGFVPGFVQFALNTSLWKGKRTSVNN